MGVVEMENDSAARFGTYDRRREAMVDWSKLELSGETGGEQSDDWVTGCLSGLLLSEKQEAMDHLEPRRLWLWLAAVGLLLPPCRLRLAMPLKMDERRRMEEGVEGPLKEGELGAVA